VNKGKMKNVCSYGTGKNVCFPGQSFLKPRIFPFGISYRQMYETLEKEDPILFDSNGVFEMLEKNFNIKESPEHFQSLETNKIKQMDFIVCLDYRVFLNVLDDLQARKNTLTTTNNSSSDKVSNSTKKKSVSILCLEVEDTPKEAEKGGEVVLALCQELEQVFLTIPSTIKTKKYKEIVHNFQKKHQVPIFFIEFFL
jgi:RNA polymerase II subunit A C-terminal domain phosphatase SSU72